MPSTEALLLRLGIADKITPYSYQRGDFAYLEEDRDLSLFMNTAKATGIEIKFDHYTADKSSSIRNYASYVPDRTAAGSWLDQGA